MSTIAVLGAGGWGTTLSILLHGNGHAVHLWEFFPERAENLSRLRENHTFLPGISIPGEIEIGSDLERSLSRAEMAIFALPSHLVRDLAHQAASKMDQNVLSVNVAKGLEKGTLKRMSEVLHEELANGTPIVTLSGPSHAEEVSRGIPTAVVAASLDEEINRRVQEMFMSHQFRVYTNKDIVGVELAGSLKNVIAIAAGISDGLCYGDNTKGALITRGLAEISRLGIALGASAQTFAGLSGMGDMITTCMSRHSRNRHVGEQIGRGKSLDEVLASMEMVAEGVNTTQTANDLARAKDIEMPIAEQVHQVLFQGKDPAKAVGDLMSRGPKAEVW